MLDRLQNLHMHSVYCDGKNTIEEIAEWAYTHGFESIGLSGHSHMQWQNPTISMTPEKVAAYKKDIEEVKKKHEGKLDIFTGIELEFYSETDLDGFDYIIGSTHYFKIDNKMVGFDSTPEWSRNVIDTYFGGNGIDFAKAYYKQIAQLHSCAKIDIIGHFDICAKHFETIELFDTGSKEYKNAAIEALEALAGRIPFFEVNTGCIPRGYRSIPYPMPFIVKEMKRLGFGAIISSDCHDMTKMDNHFDDAAELLRSCGYTERYILTKNGFEAVKL